MTHEPLTAARLRQVMRYDASTGIFTALVNRRGLKRGADRLLGTRTAQGYRKASVDGRVYPLHHLAWLWAYGRFPAEGKVLDHINGDPSDNRLVNLREARHHQNAWNSKTPTSNTSGFKGVSRLRKRWRASIALKGKRLFLGSFDTPEAAAAAGGYAGAPEGGAATPSTSGVPASWEEVDDPFVMQCSDHGGPADDNDCIECRGIRDLRAIARAGVFDMMAGGQAAGKVE